MMSSDLEVLYNQALKTLEGANEEWEASKKVAGKKEADKKKESADKLYEKGLKQYSNYKKELENKYQLLEKKIQPYIKKFEASRGSSKTDLVQVGFFPTDPSPKLSHVVKLSDVKLNPVGGLENCKQVLIEAALWPKNYPQFFTENRKPWRAVLLFGPPGTGKTLLAKTIAEETKFKFFSISPSDIVSKWMGESEQHVSALFQEARKEAPSIIFLDEVDSLCGPRGENNENEPSRRIKSELLVHMQRVCDGEDHVLILAATNAPYDLDKAIRRRFDMRIYIPLPNYEARKRIFEIEIGKTPSSINEKRLQNLANKTEGFSGSDISSYVKDALYHSIRATLRAEFFTQTEDNMWVPCQDAGVPHKKSLQELENENQNSKIQVPKIAKADFEKVRCRHKRTVTDDDLKLYEEFEKEFGVSGEM